MKTKHASVDLNRLVQEARRHRCESGDLKHWVDPQTMAALLLQRETEVVCRHKQDGGLQYLEVLFRGERFITVAKTLANLFPEGD